MKEFVYLKVNLGMLKYLLVPFHPILEFLMNNLN